MLLVASALSACSVAEEESLVEKGPEREAPYWPALWLFNHQGGTPPVIDSLGHGFLATDELILTAAHVIYDAPGVLAAKAKEIVVRFGYIGQSATLRGSDARGNFEMNFVDLPYVDREQTLFHRVLTLQEGVNVRAHPQWKGSQPGTPERFSYDIAAIRVPAGTFPPSIQRRVLKGPESGKAAQALFMLHGPLAQGVGRLPSNTQRQMVYVPGLFKGNEDDSYNAAVLSGVAKPQYGFIVNHGGPSGSPVFFSPSTLAPCSGRVPAPEYVAGLLTSGGPLQTNSSDASESANAIGFVNLQHPKVSDFVQGAFAWKWSD